MIKKVDPMAFMRLAFCADITMPEDSIHYPFIEDELPRQNLEGQVNGSI